jgi:deoxyribonuclease-4
MKQIKLGAHTSIAGGLEEALERVVKIGGNCLQIFSFSPLSWRQRELTRQQSKKFNQIRKRLGVAPIYFHAVYLINLASPGPTGKKSVQSLIHELQLAAKLGIKGSVIHPGSYKNGDQQTLIKNITRILQQTPSETLLILENAGSRKIGRSIDELARILNKIDHPRLRICLDTCHLHAAGYDLNGKKKLEQFLSELEQKIGLKKLELWHLNDSRDPLGSLRDRHENIGQGQVGIEVFRGLLNHPQLKHLPFIIETPGFKDRGPDQQNIAVLKSLIQKQDTKML